MTSGRLMAAASAAIALAMLVVYVMLADPPAVWFLAGLAAGALLAGYGAVRGRRRAALIASGVLLVALGLVGILSIGLPIVVAGVLAIVAAVQKRDARYGQ